jgi:putative transposase
MSRLKHHEAPGSSYFVITKCYQGRTIFQVSENTEVLIKTLLYYRKEGAYLLHEFVIMPDHLQVLVTPSPTTEGVSQLIKGGSSHRIHAHRNHKVEIVVFGRHAT